MTTLSKELADTVDVVRGAVPPAIFAAIGQSIADLDASGIASRAADVGERIDLPVLTDIDGAAIDLRKLASTGPLVLIFYRGGWCPYCNVTLQAYARARAEFDAVGARLVAITPETVENARDTDAKAAPGFPVVVDEGNAFARTLGLVFALPDELRPQYRQIGIDLEAWNGDSTHELPLAATYVVAADGTIRWSFVEADFTRRAEPSAVLAHLKSQA